MSQSKKSAQTLGFPDGFKTWSPFPFAGVNQSASRIGMDDKQFYWLENLVRVGDAKFRALGDVGPALYTAPDGLTIVYFFWFNINAVVYVAIFLSDGTAVQVEYPSGAQTTISGTTGTFYLASSGQLPACSQYGTQYLLISNNNTENDYRVWDGSVLYGAGGLSPATTQGITDGGAGYTSVPSYLVFGGTGSGVVLTPVIANGSVVALDVVNAGTGYLPGQIVQVAFSGGGSDTSAELAPVISAGAVNFLTLVRGGSGYTNGTFALGFSGGGGGSGATGLFTVTGGLVTSVQLTAGGTAYTASPTITFPGAGAGSGAAVVASLTGGSVTAVGVVNGGSGFTGTPTLTISGGGGSGAQAVAVMAGGAIASVTVTNGGSGYTSTPTATVETAVNGAAAATLDLMPFGVSGVTVETYQQRVWLAYPNQTGKQSNGGTLFVSAPGSLSDFATSDGGDIFTNTDRFLRQQYTFLRQTSNFLYSVGDSSTSVISNVQTSGNPSSTTFSYQNTDPQTGSSWRDTAQDFANTILFGNTFGIYGVYGGSVRKVSEDVDELFNNAVLPPAAGALTPSAAVVNLYAKRHYVFLFTTIDPTTQQQRNIMLLWDQKAWYVASQSPALTFIASEELNSGLTTWGTDGKSLYPLFQTPSATLLKKVSTKQYGGAQSFLINMLHSLYIGAVDMSGAQSGLTFTASIDNVGLAVPVVNSVTQQIQSVPTTVVPFGRPLTFQAPQPSGAVYGLAAPQVPGLAIGLNLISYSPDFVVNNLTLGYIDYAGVA